MPDTTELAPPDLQSNLAKEISAKTTAAVTQTFDSDFEAEMQSAIDKDAGKEAPTAPIVAVPTKPVAEKTASQTAPPMPSALDIPDTLLAKKENKPAGEPLAPTQTEAEREKFIAEQTKGLSPKAADRFRAQEAVKHEAVQRASKLELELKAAQEQLKKAPPPQDNTELERLRKENEQYDEMLKKAQLAEHPKFKAHYDGQIAAEIESAKKLVAPNKAEEVASLLGLPDSRERNRRLNEIVEDMDKVEAGKLVGAIGSIDKLQSGKAAELNNWRENIARTTELSRKEQELAASARHQSVEAAFTSVATKFSNEETGVELFRKVEGNDDWNKGVEARLENVKKLTSANLTPQDQAEMAAWAMSGAEYRKLFLSQRVLVKRLQEEVASLKGGAPDLGSGGAGSNDAEEGGNMIDVIGNMARKAGALQ